MALSTQVTTSVRKRAPESTPESRSTAIDRPEPLCAPKGKRNPASAAAGSVVGRPSLSAAQPSGIGRPAFSAARILPRAATLIAMSRMKCAPSAPGAATQNGLLPSRSALPPQGGMVVEALVPASMTNPASQAMRP